MKRISRHYTDKVLENATIETRIAVYEDQIRGWFHDQARILEKSSDHCAFILLMVSFMYMEGHAMFLKGGSSEKQSKKFFKIGFKEVFQEGQGTLPSEITEDQLIDEIYKRVRCGLFHTGGTREKVVLSRDFPDMISVHFDKIKRQISEIRINPHKVLDAVEEHLSKYVTKLRNPSEKLLRKNFEKAWNIR